MLFEFKTTASHEAKGWHDTVTEYLFAYSFDHAKHHIMNRLKAAGWTVDKIEGQQIPFEDIRDLCDHITTF